MQRPLLARLGPAWIIAALLVCTAAAATLWPLLAPPDPPARQAAHQPAQPPSGAALFSALTSSQTALFQDDIAALGQLVRGLDPAVAEAIAPLRERIEALQRREERAAGAAPPAMVLAQFAASVDAAAAMLATGAVAQAPPASPLLSPIAAIVAGIMALAATPLALLRGGGEAAGGQARQAEIAGALDLGVQSVLAEMAKFRGDVSQARQSVTQATGATERLASIAEIVGERVVQTALDIERAAEQTAALPAQILEQAGMLADVSRQGREASTLLVRLIDDAATRDDEERARLETLAGTVATIEAATERCVSGVRPLLTSLETIAALPATLEATIDRAATAAGERAATAGVDALVAMGEAALAPRMAELAEVVAARYGEAVAATEAEARAQLAAAVAETLGLATARIEAASTEASAAVEASIARSATSLDTVAAPLRSVVADMEQAASSVAAAGAVLAEDAGARAGLGEQLRHEIRAALAQDLTPIALAFATSAQALQPLPDVLSGLSAAASALAGTAARHEAAAARLDETLASLAAQGDHAGLLAAVVDRIAEDVDALGEVRGSLAALVDHVSPAVERIAVIGDGLDATLQEAAAARLALADAAARLDASGEALSMAAEAVGAATTTDVGNGLADPAVDVPASGSVAGAILSRLDDAGGQASHFAAIRSALTEIDVVQDAVSRLAREAEALAEDVAAQRRDGLPAPVQQHLPDLLATIDATIGRLHSAATAIAYATDGAGMRGAA